MLHEYWISILKLSMKLENLSPPLQHNPNNNHGNNHPERNKHNPRWNVHFATDRFRGAEACAVWDDGDAFEFSVFDASAVFCFVVLVDDYLVTDFGRVVQIAQGRLLHEIVEAVDCGDAVSFGFIPLRDCGDICRNSFFSNFMCYKVLKKCGLVEVCLKFYIFYFVCTIALHREGVYG